MFEGNIDVDGGNYVITSESLYVPNMEEEVDKVSRFVKGKGGSHRDRSVREGKTPNGMNRGYFRRIHFRHEFFLEGIIITLSGNTLKDRKYFVDPGRRDLQRDLRSGRGVGLIEFDEYEDYEKKRVNEQIEQYPQLTDPGYICITLEGAVRHLAQDSPEFFAVTGLSNNWPMPLQLCAPEEPKEETPRDKVIDALKMHKNLLDYTKERAMEEYPEIVEKHGKGVFNQVWKSKRKKSKKK
jgi:hypothetical protein